MEPTGKYQVPLRIHLNDLKAGSELMDRDITVETVITSRYLLLKDLMDEYGERLNVPMV